MSGVLFVVHIPSKQTEQKLRDNKNKDTVTENHEKNIGYIRSDCSGNATPLTTPEMQRYGTFFKVRSH